MELSPTAEFDSEKREVLSRNDLLATAHRPLKQCKGTVVLVPGWSGTRAGPADLLVFLASSIARAGWTAIRVEMPARGDSSGDFNAVDLDAMITAAASAANGENSALHFVGLCSGGNVALGASTTRNSLVAISTLPFQPARTKTFDDRRRWKNLKNYAAKALSPNTWARLIKGEINMDRVKKNVSAGEKPASGERNLKDSSRDIEKELLDWKGPGLFIWGSGDEEAAPARAHFEKLHAAGMGSREKTVFHTIEGANHNFYSRAWREELARRILDFIETAR
jgi:pimeloyl-ACP methyl ester carboxylesterase